METCSKSRTRRSEAGVALLIAIFVLMLVSVVAISLIVSSGTESALDGNYRSSGNAYYAALAGLEEARGRLLPKNPSYLNATNCIPVIGTPILKGNVCYITNPVGGEDVLAAYPDTEYAAEFGGAPGTVQTAVSVSGTNAQGLPGPLYKWVRINAVTESAINIDVNGDSYIDPNTTLFYDPANVDASGNPKPGLVVLLPPPTRAVQALEITSLAVLPNGSEKMLQYTVAPFVLTPDIEQNPADFGFPAALTLSGNSVTFSGGSTFTVSGTEMTSSGGCANSSHAAIGYTNPSDSSNMNSAATPAGNYTGGTPNNIANVNDPTQTAFILSRDWQTPSGLDAVVQGLTQAADVVVNGPATEAIMPAAMSATNPMTIVVNGDLTFNSWHGVGYGILVVTGTFNYDPDATWNGIVLVVGQGKFVSAHGAGAGSFNGAVLVAQTRDSSGKLLPDPNLGPASFSNTGVGSIHYNSCWINTTLGSLQYSIRGPLSYRILSFRERPLS